MKTVRMPLVVGCDPGNTGAICAMTRIKSSPKILTTIDFKLENKEQSRCSYSQFTKTVSQFMRQLNKLKIDFDSVFLFVEKPTFVPFGKKAALISQGLNIGTQATLLAQALDTPPIFITPQEWAKNLPKIKGHKNYDLRKSRNISTVEQLFGLKLNDGLADSILISYYGLGQLSF